MFLINGSIKCSDIDYGTNTFYINHDFGFVKSATKSFSFEFNGTIEQFRPAYVTFHDGKIKISLGTYRFNQNGTIHYSFVAFKTDEIKYPHTSKELFARLRIIEEAILYAKLKIKNVIPGDVVIKSDIEFNTVQSNSNPRFYWDTPNTNSESSNSSDSDTGARIVGYYYSFNNIENYIVTKIDSYIKESSNSNSTNVFVRFPSSGTYYFHVRAVNSVGEISRNTSHATVIYNNPPTEPKDLINNGHKYYRGSANIDILSWLPSHNSDGDSIYYELSIYRNNELFFNDYIKALKCNEEQLFAKLNIEESSNSGDLDELPDGPVDNLSNSLSESQSITKFEDIMSKKRYVNRMYYIFNGKGNIDISKNRSGSYYYRLRAYDWAEQSSWSEICYYYIFSSNIDFKSKVWIGYNFENDFGRVPMFGKLFIKGMSWFFGTVYLVPELIGKMSVMNSYSSPGLYAILKFKYYDTLYCKMNIDTNFSDIYGKLNIKWVPYYSTMFSKLRIVEKGASYFDFIINFRDFNYSGFYGELFVIANNYSGFNGLVKIIRERMSGKLKVLREFAKDGNYDYNKLLCKMFVDNYPQQPKITCTVGHDWQSNNIVTFSWSAEDTNIKIIAFEYYLSSVQISDFSSVQFIRTISKKRTFNLSNYNMDSEYYLYVRSVGSNGSYSNPSVYTVRYNNIPSTPSYPMYINDKECIENIPVISRSEYNTFKWPKSEHADMDVVNYHVQISNKSDFSNIIIEIDNINDISESSFIDTKIKYNYSENNTIYYWRVRAYDRYQYTEYGHVGRFKCNTKPGVPTNLSVSNKD